MVETNKSKFPLDPEMLAAMKVSMAKQVERQANL